MPTTTGGGRVGEKGEKDQDKEKEEIYWNQIGTVIWVNIYIDLWIGFQKIFLWFYFLILAAAVVVRGRTDKTRNLKKRQKLNFFLEPFDVVYT